MSQVGVGMVVEKLLADESLRIQFALDRMETIADLCLGGIELTRDEIDLINRTDARLWFLGDHVRREWRSEDECVSCDLAAPRRHGNGDFC
jgi:hypothetical protein